MSDDITGFARFEREADELDDAAQTSEDEEATEDLEAPEADAAEQRFELLQHRDEPIIRRPGEREAEEADPADAAEQRRVVHLDEDDYRD
jgi:hypothetical protein